MNLDQDTVCHICAKKFQTKKYMLLHKKSHTQTFNCEPCGIQYSLEPSLKRHLDTIHTENPRYVCPHCNKKNGGKNEHEKHIKTHDVDSFYTFACPQCKKICKTEDSVKKHIKYIHTNPKDKECSVCHQKFAYSSYLLAHISNVHRVKPLEEFFYCNLCDQKLKSATTLRIHKRMHTGEKPFKCEACEKTFRQHTHRRSHTLKAHIELSKSSCTICSLEFNDINRHMNRMHSGYKIEKKEVACKQCDLKFPSKYSARSHLLKVHRPDISFKCTSCDFKSIYRKDLISHNRIHTGERPFKCNSCEYAATQQNILKSHIKVHHAKEIEMVQCEICSKTVRKISVQTHIKSHNSEKTIKCTKCDSSFKSKDHLRGHLSLHMKIRPYQCMICPKQFKRKGHLEVHQEFHDESLTNACNICNKIVYRSNLQSHLKTHTDKNMFVCSICDKRLKTPATLKDHSKTHSKIKPYACPLCRASFSQSYSMKIHLNTHRANRKIK